jgi:hypothetical protein
MQIEYWQCNGAYKTVINVLQWRRIIAFEVRFFIGNL